MRCGLTHNLHSYFSLFPKKEKDKTPKTQNLSLSAYTRFSKGITIRTEKKKKTGIVARFFVTIVCMAGLDPINFWARLFQEKVYPNRTLIRFTRAVAYLEKFFPPLLPINTIY